LLIGQKVKDCAVVPKIERVRWKVDFGNVSLDPRYGLSLLSKTSPRCRKCGCGKVQDGQRGIAFVKQVVDERGRPSPDVNNRCSLRQARIKNPAERSLSVFLIPAERIRSRSGVDALPMYLRLHGNSVVGKSWAAD
jgi:hypothetical protein